MVHSQEWAANGILLLSIGMNKPDLSKLSEISIEIFFPILNSSFFNENKSVIAIGVSLIVPWVKVTSKAKILTENKMVINIMIVLFFIF